MKLELLVAGALLASAPVWAQSAYKLPPQEIVDAIDAPPTPLALVSPARDAMLLVGYRANPSIELLAEPFLKLAGLRVNPRTLALQHLQQYTDIRIQSLVALPAQNVPLPEPARLGLPVWSPDGKRFAFTRDVEDGVELWCADAKSGRAAPLAGLRVSDVLGAPFVWENDNRHLLVRAVPAGRGPALEASRVPSGPDVEETAGKHSKVATYQDLLQNERDAALFEYYATSQLARVDVETSKLQPVGAPGMFSSPKQSPDGKYLLVTKLARPFSYRVPYYAFTRSLEIWNAGGAHVRSIAELPVADEVPPQGVPTGPRDPEWNPLQPASLVWAEALDGGDPMHKVPQRDKLMALAAPFAGDPRELLRVKGRYTGIDWTAKRDRVLIDEFDRDQRWTTTRLADLASPRTAPKTVFDLSVNDAYNSPGTPFMETRADGRTTLLQDGDWVYFAGKGASESGERPFLDRLNLRSLQKERLYRSDSKSYESCLAFAGASRGRVLTRYESPTEPPNYFVVDLATKQRVKLTDFKDPAPKLSGLKKQLLRYHRADGVPLSGMLYLPPDYQPGTRLPLVLWAYPLEFSDAGTAGQVRGSPNTFTRLVGPSPLFFVTQGYALLNDATMPVIGDPETMNDTFVEQIVGAAKAAIDTLDALGLADRNRVVVGGHSYGAFMTANLLAHSDLFAAGIARSGAYNRSLTPFGFQSERRSYWEATDVYTKISPFTFANRIHAPLLLVHGAEDNNSGTHTIQSQRLFQAIQGNGGTARLVLLPFEAHGYRARESVLHVLAEMIEWADKYAKNRPQTASRSD